MFIRFDIDELIECLVKNKIEYTTKYQSLQVANLVIC